MPFKVLNFSTDRVNFWNEQKLHNKMNLGITVTGSEKENLAGKFYDVFIGRSENKQLEFDNDEHIISKEESRARITLLQLVFCLLCLISTSTLVSIFELISIGKISIDVLEGKLNFS